MQRQVEGSGKSGGKNSKNRCPLNVLQAGDRLEFNRMSKTVEEQKEWKDNEGKNKTVITKRSHQKAPAEM